MHGQPHIREIHYYLCIDSEYVLARNSAVRSCRPHWTECRSEHCSVNVHGKCAFLSKSDHRQGCFRLVAIVPETASVTITALPARTQSHSALRLIALQQQSFRVCDVGGLRSSGMFRSVSGCFAVNVSGHLPVSMVSMF